VLARVLRIDPGQAAARVPDGHRRIAQGLEARRRKDFVRVPKLPDDGAVRTFVRQYARTRHVRGNDEEPTPVASGTPRSHLRCIVASCSRHACEDARVSRVFSRRAVRHRQMPSNAVGCRLRGSAPRRGDGLVNADALYDEDGRPLRRHRPCPVCDTFDEVCSEYDVAWCGRCGWRGELSAMHAPVYPDLFTHLDRRRSYR
jgi:hypothetical protein